MTLLQIGESFGDYKIISQIGKGASSECYIAKSHCGTESLALKVLYNKDELNPNSFFTPDHYNYDPALLVDNEFDLVNSLDHDNIIKYYEKIMINNHHALTTRPIVDGFPQASSSSCNLKREIELNHYTATNSRHQYPFFEHIMIYDILGQIKSGVLYLIDKGIVHKDIKPSNILLAGDRFPIISDFGTAHSIHAPNNFIGSFSYTAPEVFAGKAHKYSDLWSLGLINLHFIFGKHPFSMFPISMYQPKLKKTLSEKMRDVLSEINKGNISHQPPPGSLGDYLGWSLEKHPDIFHQPFPAEFKSNYLIHYGLLHISRNDIYDKKINNILSLTKNFLNYDPTKRLIVD